MPENLIFKVNRNRGIKTGSSNKHKFISSISNIFFLKINLIISITEIHLINSLIDSPIISDVNMHITKYSQYS
jgi:hypothetical protein